MRRRWVVAVVAVIAFGSGACGAEGNNAAASPPATTEPTVVPTATAAVATEVPTATPSPTEVPEPTPEPVDDETLVRAVHTRFMTELFARDEREVGRFSHFDLLDELTVDPQNRRDRNFAERSEQDGLFMVGPGYDSNISEVEISGKTATVFDCSQGRGAGWSNGEEVIPADDFWKWRNTKLIKIADVWYVEDFITGGDGRCDPKDFPGR